MAASQKSIDISRLDLRLGKIVEVDRHPDADSSYVDKIDSRDSTGAKHIKHVPTEEMTTDPNQPRHDRVNSPNSDFFNSWIENALVAISPNGDYILFSSHIPEKITFFGKLRKEPVNQYVTKPLNVPLDYDEYVTSLLCLPIMSTQKTSLGSVDWTVFAIGLSSGYVKFYTEHSTCLISIKFCDEVVTSIKCQTKKINTNASSKTHFATLVDEILVTFKGYAVVLDGLTLFENLRIAKNDVVRNGSHFEPAYNLTNLPFILNCQKWKIDYSFISDGELLGTRLTTTFDILKRESINQDQMQPKTCARTLACAGRYPFLTCYFESQDSSTHSYTEIIGSLFSLWNKPQPSQVQMIEVAKSFIKSISDDGRQTTSITASPDKRLVALTDDFGRVLLVDCTNFLVIRIWKGYRSAQCGWIEVKKEPLARNSRHASLLVIYAPKRGLLEVWSAQRGPRVAAFNVGKHCRLLYSGYKMLNMRAEAFPKGKNISHQPWEQSYSSNCYLLDAMSKTVFAVELPYTYSLYRYGDFKSRDQLLINELTTAIDLDLEIEACTEILHRISLAESLNQSIEKLALGLAPSKVSIIMESLINKIMRNYDHHPGESLTEDDENITQSCKRVIKLCAMYQSLSDSEPRELSLPDVNRRLIDQYEEHPQEIDEFSRRLGWPSSEVLRCLSLLALERSICHEHQSNPWPTLGEPLSWFEFINCFDLHHDSDSNLDKSKKGGNLTLRQLRKDFLASDCIIKTALFMYNRLSEAHCNATIGKSPSILDDVSRNFDQLDAPSRLVLLFRFWLSTGLSKHWKMWTFLQSQADCIADELKSISLNQSSESILVNVWKLLYQLIIESDNLFAAITATSTLRTLTLKIIGESANNEESQDSTDLKTDKDDEETERVPSIDWEHLCVDAERMSILRQQVTDIHLLNLLLNYSFKDCRMVEYHQYRIARISVANVLRGGPTIVSELVAQWVIQSGVNYDVITKPYGSQTDDDGTVLISDSNRPETDRFKQYYRLNCRKSSDKNDEEQVKELIHHVKTAFPYSLEPDIILLNCVWELCRRWSLDQATLGKAHIFRGILECLLLIQNIELKHKLANMIYKTFFQINFERLVGLVEANSSIVSVKNSRIRDSLTRKELNMSEDCIEEFVQFCCDLTEFILQTLGDLKDKPKDSIDTNEDENLSDYDRLMTMDSWWINPIRTTGCIMSRPSNEASDASTDNPDVYSDSLVKATLQSSNFIDVDVLIELNKLSNLLNLIFKLKIVEAHPMSLIGEKSRQILQLDLSQMLSADTTTGNSKLQGSSNMSHEQQDRSAGQIDALRRKFARKCILTLVCKLDEDNNELNEEECSRELEVDKSKKPGERLGAEKDLDIFTTKVSKYKLTRQSTSNDEWENSTRMDSNGIMIIFSNLLSLASEWDLNCDELHLDLVFELYRCNHDKIASQLSTRVLDKQTLADGLLKISSQRLLVLYGLSPHLSGPDWRLRSDRWSLFAPNLASWLRSIQKEEMKGEIASLSFADSLRSNTQGRKGNQELKLPIFVLQTLRVRTKLVLDRISNYLEGQASRLAHNMSQVLESEALDRLLSPESENS